MKKRARKEKSLARVIWGWLLFVFVMILLSFIVVHFVNHNTLVAGNAMYPTLADQDRIILDTVSYHVLNPGRFDIVVFPSRYQEDVYYIRRIVGLPGETVQIVDGRVYINGALLQEKISVEDMRNPGTASSVVTLAADEYFVLGDNRNESSDSREPIIGTIRGDDIIGRAIMKVWPLNRVGFLF